MQGNGMTVGDLKRELRGFADDTKLNFAGGLTFYRVKRCSADDVFIEFDEPEGYLSPEFKKRNPNVKVVFIETENVEWSKSGMSGTIDVSVH